MNLVKEFLTAQGYETLTVKNSFTKFIFSAVYSGS